MQSFWSSGAGSPRPKLASQIHNDTQADEWLREATKVYNKVLKFN